MSDYFGNHILTTTNNALDSIKACGANLIEERFDSNGGYEVRVSYDDWYRTNDWVSTKKAYDQFCRGIFRNDSNIEKVIFNDPATIVFWKDGTKTIVKCSEDDTFDKEKGLAMAISKKIFGTLANENNYRKIFKKWIEED